jgi:hypothetical protein
MNYEEATRKHYLTGRNDKKPNVKPKKIRVPNGRLIIPSSKEIDVKQRVDTRGLLSHPLK